MSSDDRAETRPEPNGNGNGNGNGAHDPQEEDREAVVAKALRDLPSPQEALVQIAKTRKETIQMASDSGIGVTVPFDPEDLAELARGIQRARDRLVSDERAAHEVAQRRSRDNGTS